VQKERYGFMLNRDVYKWIFTNVNEFF